MLSSSVASFLTNVYPRKVFSSSVTGIKRIKTPSGTETAPTAIVIHQWAKVKPAVLVNEPKAVKNIILNVKRKKV